MTEPGSDVNMSPETLREVADRWLNEAQSAVGSLPEGASPAPWILSRLVEWLQVEAGTQLADAKRASAGIRAAVTAAGGWNDSRTVPAMDELTHLDDSLADLARLLGIASQGSQHAG